MAFNVCDRDGMHLGVLCKPFSIYTNIYQMAITELMMEDIGIDMNRAEMAVANLYGCKTITGKLNRDKLNNVFSELKKNEYAQFLDAQYEDILKLSMINNNVVAEKLFEKPLDRSNTKGYILFDIAKVDLVDGKIIMEEDIQYALSQEIVSADIPILGKIVDYPKAYIKGLNAFGIMTGTPSLMNNLAHEHTTELKIKSGNVINEIEIYINLQSKKDTNIQLFYEGEKLFKIFYEGMFYFF